MGEPETYAVVIEGYGCHAGRSYATTARLTAGHVVTEAGLRFSRKTGNHNGRRRNLSHGLGGFRLSPGSLEMVRPKEDR